MNAAAVKVLKDSTDIYTHDDDMPQDALWHVAYRRGFSGYIITETDKHID